MTVDGWPFSFSFFYTIATLATTTLINSVEISSIIWISFRPFAFDVHSTIVKVASMLKNWICIAIAWVSKSMSSTLMFSIMFDIPCASSTVSICWSLNSLHSCGYASFILLLNLRCDVMLDTYVWDYGFFFSRVSLLTDHVVVCMKARVCLFSRTILKCIRCFHTTSNNSIWVNNNRKKERRNLAPNNNITTLHNRENVCLNYTNQAGKWCRGMKLHNNVLDQGIYNLQKVYRVCVCVCVWCIVRSIACRLVWICIYTIYIWNPYRWRWRVAT